LGWNPRKISQHKGNYFGPGGSVDVLNERRIGVGFLTGAGDTSLRHSVQDGAEDQTATYLGRTGDSFNEGEGGECVEIYLSIPTHISSRCGA